MKFKSIGNEKGFTLVELAIVLVIIGIILGGVLKGQELITNAKIKRAYSTQKEVAAAIYTYFDRYGFYPGDDPQAVAKFPAVALTNGNGNGLIAVAAATTNANFACTATGTEQCDLWAELRLSNMLSGGSGGLFVNPAHPFGGAVAVTYFNMPAVAGGAGSPTSTALLAQWVMLGNVPYDVCQILDRQYDDGWAGSGSIRSVAGDYMTATTGIFSIGFRL